MSTLLAISSHAINQFSDATSNKGRELWAEGLELLQHLISYVGDTSNLGTSVYREILQRVASDAFAQLNLGFQCFEVSNFALQLLEDHYDFLSPQMRGILAAELTGPKGLRRGQELLDGDGVPGNQSFAMLLVTFCRQEVKQFLNNNQSTANTPALLALIGFIKCEEHYEEQNSLLANVMEFWCLYLEEAVEIDSSPNSNSLDRLQAARISTQAALDALIEKLRLPPNDEIEDWDNDARDNFYNVRRDFRDFSANTCTLLGHAYTLTSVLNYANEKWLSKSWEDVEIALQCFLGYMEAVDNTPEGNAALERFMTSNVMGVDTPRYTHNIIGKPILQIIRDSGSFCSGNKDAMENALDYIFVQLRTPKIANDAARTLLKFCNNNQRGLLGWVDDFIGAFELLLSEDEISDEVKEKVVGAMASVTHAAWEYAAKEDASKQGEADRMLTLTLQAVDTYYTAFIDGTSDNAYESALTSVRCIANVSKAFEKALVVNLDGEDRGSKFTVFEPRRSFIEGVHNRIILIIYQTLKAFPEDARIMEAVCDVVRPSNTGVENPFAFHANFVESIVREFLNTTQSYGYLLTTAFRFMRRWDGNSEEDQALAASLLSHVYNTGDITKLGPDFSLTHLVTYPKRH